MVTEKKKKKRGRGHALYIPFTQFQYLLRHTWSRTQTHIQKQPKVEPKFCNKLTFPSSAAKVTETILQATKKSQHTSIVKKGFNFQLQALYSNINLLGIRFLIDQLNKPLKESSSRFQGLEPISDSDIETLSHNYSRNHSPHTSSSNSIKLVLVIYRYI